jgi:hypothetical protein
LQHAQRFADGRPLIIAGDFNFNPENSCYSVRPTVHTLPPPKRTHLPARLSPFPLFRSHSPLQLMTTGGLATDSKDYPRLPSALMRAEERRRTEMASRPASRAAAEAQEAKAQARTAATAKAAANVGGRLLERPAAAGAFAPEPGSEAAAAIEEKRAVRAAKRVAADEKAQAEGGGGAGAGGKPARGAQAAAAAEKEEEEEWAPAFAPFRSAYREARGAEPPFTNWAHTRESKEPFVDALDYVFVADGAVQGALRTTGAAALPTVEEVREGGWQVPFPSGEQPSDHLLLSTSFSLV